MKEVLLCAALAAVLSALFRLLMPSSRYRKQIGFSIACFFILVIADSVYKNIVDIKEISATLSYKSEYIDFSEAEKNDIKQSTAVNIEEKINSLLEKNNIFAEKISAVIDISDNNCISIKQIRLVFPIDASAELKNAEEIVKKEVGDETEVVGELYGR